MNLLILSVLLNSTAVCSEITPLPQGGRAPCNGILWTLAASKKALACRQVEIPRLKAENAALQGTLHAEARSCTSQITALDAQVLTYHVEIQELKKPTPWYLSSYFWAPVALGVGLSIGISIGGF
jgi:hypothetical protein